MACAPGSVTTPELAALARRSPAWRGVLRAPRVLDVGTGTGALLPFYRLRGIPPAQITGVDLCGAMLEHARLRFPEATFLEQDFLQVGEGEEPFDAVVFNAVFANLYDQQAALRHAATLLRDGGGVVIAHPLGAGFVKGLKASDPTVVPHEPDC